MQKEIYKRFTLENGIIISMPALNYISEHIATLEELQALISAFKSKFNTSSVEIKQIEQILNNKKEASSFSIIKFKYKQRKFSDEFEKYKALINRMVFPISTLEIDSISTIYGILYKNKRGSYVIEDDHDAIELNFSKTNGDSFVFENMFLAAKGCKRTASMDMLCNSTGDSCYFEVTEIILPSFIPNTLKNNFLDDIKKKICVFGSFETEKYFIDSVIKRESPDIVIISTKKPDLKKEFSNWNGKVICCSCKEDGSFLPSQTQEVSNPFVLELYDKSIGFIDSEFFRNRQNGMFINGQNLIESFLKSYLSQSSLDPFSRSDMYLNEMPNFIIFSQNTYPFVLDVEGIKFISVPPFKEKAYGILDFKCHKFEIAYYNEDSNDI